MRALKESSPLRIRPATPADIPAILCLEHALASAAHWGEPAYRQIFAPDSPSRIALVLEDEGYSLCGFVVARLIPGECELENIAVSQSLQRAGAGTLLLRSLVAETRQRNLHSIRLEVRESNAAARSLYVKCGFASMGRRPKYYSNPEEDAVLYSIQL
jgi:[ribosomal protein S18]-alanine N-acetyltransferase